MIKHMRSVAFSSMLLLLAVLVACGSSLSRGPFEESATLQSRAAPAAPAAPAPAAPSIEPDSGFAGLPGFPGSPGAPAPRPAPAPAAPAPAAAAAAPAPTSGGFFGDDANQGQIDESVAEAQTSGTGTGEEAELVSQQRIIIRTVDMTLVVGNVATTLDDIANLAQGFDGWVVSSDRSAKHRGFISLRVPAEQLGDAILQLRGMAVEVEAESTTSRDVTDEYVDNRSRLVSLKATEEALLALLNKAEKVEDALNVQRELARLQADIESKQGRIKFLEETSAFSLINVFLRLSPVDMPVDAGPDQTFSLGENARFRATFTPPEGIEDFTFTWDFGDGSPPVVGNRTAPTTDEDSRITATVTHNYFDERDSPYIVEVEMTGTGDAGVAEGSDTFIATVTKLPSIEVFAGENIVVEEGEVAEFSGAFTRPEGLTDITFKWDFGDGTPHIEGVPEEGVTRAIAEHVYTDRRPFPYPATLSITGQSEAGEVVSKGEVSVFVQEARGLIIAGWSAGDTSKTAVRTLSAVGQIAGTLLIWLGIFSPLWILGGGVAYFIARQVKRNRARNPRPPGARRVRSRRGSATVESPEQAQANGTDEAPEAENAEGGSRQT